MADATYDAVLVGGGTKALFTALYLTKYAGMEVAIFEARHELGGGLGSHEAPAPGFIGNTHASTLYDWYYLPIQEDFPDFEEKGGRFAHYAVTTGVVTKEDHKFWGVYHPEVDPSGEKTAKELARFSGEKDADTYMKIYEGLKRTGYREAMIEEAYNLAPPPDQPTAMDKWLSRYLADPDCVIDRRWTKLTAYQAAHELWESGGLKYLIFRKMKAVGIPPEAGGALTTLNFPVTLGGMMFAVGGTHSIAHACYRIYVENGGKFFTKSEVEKILIENGTAKGIRLKDGTEIAARKLVLSGVDPYQLCFDLIGKEHLSESVLRKVANLERHLTCITWYTWAVHELPNYRAAAFNPDVNDTHWLILGSHDTDYIEKEAYWRRLGQNPPGDAIVVFATHSHHDETQAPEGKHVLATEEHVVAADDLSEREWMQFKRDHAEKTIRVLQEYTTNINWDKVIGYDPITPYDIAKRQKNMAPAGNWNVIDRVPGQTTPFIPIIEMAQHRTPIKNLYATGSAWGPMNLGSSFQGYTAYKAIAEDLGLEKPWEKKGRPW